MGLESLLPRIGLMVESICRLFRCHRRILVS
jgi:hypothetical protein